MSARSSRWSMNKCNTSSNVLRSGVIEEESLKVQHWMSGLFKTQQINMSRENSWYRYNKIIIYFIWVLALLILFLNLE